MWISFAAGGKTIQKVCCQYPCFFGDLVSCDIGAKKKVEPDIAPPFSLQMN